MVERKYDQLLHVKTSGLREWKNQTDDYNRYEATPYQALEKLIHYYKLEPTDRVVDFGSGRGRVSFFLHYHFDVPITGIEMNDLTLEESKKNKVSYLHKHAELKAPLTFAFGLAEQYEIQPDENVFYFFNPFSLNIFKEVVQNIIRSVEEHNRTVDIVFYYPPPAFKKFLKKETPFKLINKIKAYKPHGKHGKFLIYRMT